MRAAALWLAVAVTGCTAIDATTRVERGPLLRTFDRKQVIEGGVRAEVTAKWPKLFVALRGHDLCRTQSVEEYAEEHTTERTSSAAGPALSTGIASTLAGLVMIAVAPALSGEPNREVIDAGGRYGPSVRTQVRGWSVVAFSVGVPALVVGAIAYLRQGVDTEVKKVEQVATQKEAVCNERDVDGPVLLMSDQRPTAEGKMVAGSAVEFDESQFATVGADRILFFGREVELDEASRKVLDAVSSCRQLALEQVAALGAISTGALMNRLERVRACRLARPDAMIEEGKALEKEVERRREVGDPGALPVGPNVTSFEEAVTSYSPRLKLSVGSPDLEKLDNLEDLVGQSAVIEGIVTEGLTPNIGVVQVGPRGLFLFLPTQKAWGGDYAVGTRVEVVAVVVGTQTLGERTLPLLRAVWMRPAFGG
ncbi:MAG: uncharacterized protein H6Q89_4081 [Myxococcaceae bacterium]|nr:uncharacterized protein [Myxococcaceae bacterium]